MLSWLPIRSRSDASGMPRAISARGGLVPTWYKVLLSQNLDQFAAQPVVEEDDQRAVRFVHDIDYQRLHLLIAKPRKSWPGNLPVGRPDDHVCIVAGLRLRSNPGVQILQLSIPEALLGQVFCESLSALPD